MAQHYTLMSADRRPSADVSLPCLWAAEISGDPAFSGGPGSTVWCGAGYGEGWEEQAELGRGEDPMAEGHKGLAGEDFL